MGAHDDLLRRFQPLLRYDSIEQYFADSPAQWTDNPGNELRRADEPDLAVYAQHRYAEKRPWPAVQKAAGRPDTAVVYVARGSHASYFEPGFHTTEAWYDLADGKRAAPPTRLEIVDGVEGWSAWP